MNATCAVSDSSALIHSMITLCLTVVIKIIVLILVTAVKVYCNKSTKQGNDLKKRDIQIDALVDMGMRLQEVEEERTAPDKKTVEGDHANGIM